MDATCCRIAHTEAVEDTLKAVFALSTCELPVTTSAIAGRLGVASPTVTAMVNRLSTNGLVTRTPDHHVELTEHGLSPALATLVHGKQT